MNASIYSTNGKMAYQMDVVSFGEIRTMRALVVSGKPTKMEILNGSVWAPLLNTGHKKFITQVEAALKD